jgi:thiamine biosynthesis lipoprotein
MRKLSFFLLALCLAGAAKLDRIAESYVSHFENVLGTSLEMKLDAESPEAADRAEAATLAEIDRLAAILSSYDKTSEFSHWFQTNGQAVAVSPELLEVLSLFDRWRTATGGALDPAAEAVNRVWKNAGKENRIPSQAELASAVSAVQRKHWSVDAAAGRVTHLSATALALNSFTKSYIIGKAANAAVASGAVTSAVVNIGGDIVVRGDRSQIVDIADPMAASDNAAPISRIVVRNSTVATSGDYKRGVEIEGRHYSHIVDPRTGQPADRIISATVVAANPADAGALATAFSVLSPAESKKLAATIPGAEYLLIAQGGRQIASSGWSKLEVVRPAMMLADVQGGAAWNPSYELNITLALNRIEGQRTRRPYIAVWIEDKDKFPVRTIALWFDKTRWLPELKGWNRVDRIRSLAEGTDITSTVSSATRPPGKYILKWDGKDNAGKLVKPGKYTVVIEASREHGTYQLMHQEMDFTGVPKQINLTGNVEVESATLDYRKTTTH